MQPYGLRLVQATRFTRAQRSTTSSVDPSKKFPICVIDSGFDATHPSLQGVSLRGGSPVGFSADTCGHGSHVAGTISARQNRCGRVCVRQRARLPACAGARACSAHHRRLQRCGAARVRAAHTRLTRTRRFSCLTHHMPRLRPAAPPPATRLC
jgi:hypothetical protein